ncbi:MAG: ATP-binding cassette domain-containing protein, partial [Clostridia bacterium]|nr:ATP-binding cassette domain-containing protein [Clostridia bacterium]
LRDGKSVQTLVTKDSTAEEMSHAMVGRKLNVIENTQEKPVGKPLLTLDGVTVFRSGRKRPALENVNVVIHEGEILGVAGVEGNGQKELAEAIVGIRRGRVKGKILLGEDDLTGTTVRVRADKGMAYVPDDRQHDALVPDMDVSENLLLRSYKKAPFSKARVFNRKRITENAQAAVKDYAVRTAGTLGVKSPARLLSGGNQQKVVLSREISPESRFIVASQPTRGLDVSASAFVREKLLEQKKQGKGVMLISADLEEILMISDRIIVMDNGRIAGELDRKDATIDSLGMLMGGITQEANA